MLNFILIYKLYSSLDSKTRATRARKRALCALENSTLRSVTLFRHVIVKTMFQL
jgi:hypothetical protein